MDEAPHSSNSNVRLAFAMSVAALLLSGSLAVWLAGCGPDASGSLASLIVVAGDHAVATASVVERPEGPYVACRLLNSRLMGHPPACSSTTIELPDFDPSLVPAWIMSGGVRYSETAVAIHGIWTGSGLRADRVEATTLAERRPAVSCPAQPGGWQPPHLSSLEEEAALRQLDAEIQAAPNRYSGLWRGYRSADDAGIVTIGTLDEPTAVATLLQPLYNGPLCVTRAEYSRADLDAVVRRLDAADASLELEVAPDLDRVIVRVDVIDSRVVSLFGADASRIYADPMLQPESSTRG